MLFRCFGLVFRTGRMLFACSTASSKEELRQYFLENRNKKHMKKKLSLTAVTDSSFQNSCH